MKNKKENKEKKDINIVIKIICIFFMTIGIGTTLYFGYRLYDSLKVRIGGGSYCTQAVNCSRCSNGRKTCNYYYGEYNTVSEETIYCDCE